MGTHFHGTKDELELYALERLADSEIVRLEEHLIVCATCRSGFEAIEAYATGMREALMTDAAEGEDSGRDLLGWLRRPAVSMGLGLLALIGVIGMFSRGPAKLAASAWLELPGSGGMATAPPARELDLTIRETLRDSGPYRAEVLNPAGQTVWSGLAADGKSGVEVKVQLRIPPGDYFLRLYSVGGEKLKDYPFRIGG